MAGKDIVSGVQNKWGSDYNREHYGPGKGMGDAPREGDIAGRYYSGAPIGQPFGLGDFSDRNRLTDDLGLMGYDTRGGLGIPKGDELLPAVNQLAEEWGMAGFQSLGEISEEFLVKLESMAGIRR